MKVIRWALVLVLAIALAIGGLLWFVRQRGFSARDEPTAIERGVARAVRDFAIPAKTRSLRNPVSAAPDVLARAKAHFADHCASCHGNDGRGDTPMGRNLYPKAPDMTAEATQSLSDGALFAIITNGVRLTGMPAWGDRSEESNRQTWELVQFIRHLPHMSDEEVEEMKGLNPRSREEWEAMVAEETFLSGGPAPPAKHGISH